MSVCVWCVCVCWGGEKAYLQFIIIVRRSWGWKSSLLRVKGVLLLLLGVRVLFVKARPLLSRLLLFFGGVGALFMVSMLSR